MQIILLASKNLNTHRLQIFGMHSAARKSLAECDQLTNWKQAGFFPVWPPENSKNIDKGRWYET
jgi:hypothetical protein